MSSAFVGCAGWSIPSRLASEFPGSGTHLERYAARFNAVEVNSSFYRLHRRATYDRWAGATPDDFRFAVKLPRAITHERRLQDAAAPLGEFLDSVAGLGGKLGPLLVQLPPSLEFAAATARRFFQAMHKRTPARIVCEPRHASWFSSEATELLESSTVARVVADPQPIQITTSTEPRAAMRYFRWHGSPKIYYSAYDAQQLAELEDRARFALQHQQTCWCIFDNTALGAALENGLELTARLAAV